jgi:hypothetical protein
MPLTFRGSVLLLKPGVAYKELQISKAGLAFLDRMCYQFAPGDLKKEVYLRNSVELASPASPVKHGGSASAGTGQLSGRNLGICKVCRPAILIDVRIRPSLDSCKCMQTHRLLHIPRLYHSLINIPLQARQ